MKLRLSIFLIGLLIAAIGIGIFVDEVTSEKNPILRARQGSTDAGFGAGLATFGIGVAIGIPIILRHRKQNQ